MSLLRKLQIFSSNVANLWTIDAANTARTTATIVGSVQIVDATGKVPPSGDTVGNSPFSKITDGTDTLLIDSQGAAHVSLKSDAGASIVDAANTGRTTGTILLPIQLVDATGKVLKAGDAVGNASFFKLTDGTNTFEITAANTGRTTGTLVLPTQNVDATGKVTPAGDTYANAAFRKSKIIDGYGFGAECTPSDELRVVIPTRTVGTSFDGVKDPNFWSETIANNGTITSSFGTIVLDTAVTTQNGSAIYQTVRRARHYTGISARFETSLKLGDTGATDNSRKWGTFDGTNGCYFELDGIVLYIVTLKAGTPTRVASTSWNVNTTVPTLTNFQKYEIYFTNNNVYFTINGVLKHTISITTATWSDTYTLPCRIATTNSNLLQTSHTLTCSGSTMYRLGQIQTLPQYKHISGVAATNVLKYTAGVLHSVILNNPTNNAITVYDAVTALGGTEIAIIDPDTSATPVILTYNVGFSVGLTIVTAGTPDLTVIYE